MRVEELPQGAECVTVAHPFFFTTTAFTRIDQSLRKQIQTLFVETPRKLSSQLNTWNISEVLHVSQTQWNKQISAGSLS